MSSDHPRSVEFMSRNDVEARAAEVRRLHGLSTVPIDPVALANKLGIVVRNAKFSDDSLVGMIAKREGVSMMLVNQSDPPYRKRFTIAHELGHHFLHLFGSDGEYVDGEADLFRQPPADSEHMTAGRRAEIQANWFAAALLMPEEDVREAWTEVRVLAELAMMFQVSEVAMGYRVAQLGLE